MILSLLYLSQHILLVFQNDSIMSYSNQLINLYCILDCCANQEFWLIIINSWVDRKLVVLLYFNVFGFHEAAFYKCAGCKFPLKTPDLFFFFIFKNFWRGYNLVQELPFCPFNLNGSFHLPHIYPLLPFSLVLILSLRYEILKCSLV